MSTRSVRRVLPLAVASALLAAVSAFGSSVAPAAANPTAGCLLGLICPPSTTAPQSATTSPATAAPPTPTTVRATATTAARATATTRAATRNIQPSVGVSGLPVYGSVNLPATGAGSDPVAPQLAATPDGASNTSTTLLAEALQPPAHNATVPNTGLPGDHRSLRIALSVMALFIAGLALAQLPASRRRPRPSDGATAWRRHVFPRP